MIRCRFLRRLSEDTEGSVLLETIVVLPVLALFMMVIMEMSLMANARQLANYAAFSAARTAAVHGIDDAAAQKKTHLAAAMAMASISPATREDGERILTAYGQPNPTQIVRTLCNYPGFQGDTALWLARLAGAFVRTGEPACDTGRVTGKTHKYIIVNVTYIYRCTILPVGIFWGHSALESYVTLIRGLYTSPSVRAAIDFIGNAWRWNIPIRGRAVMDYWAG